MSTGSAPFAAGVHLPWAQVPAHVRQWAEGVGGGPATRVVDLQGGFSPGATARLQFPRGQFFIKAVGLSLNEESPGMHRREAVISALLPDQPAFPRLLECFDDGDWVALAFEAIEGTLPRHPWDAAELGRVADALVALHVELTPTPDPSIDTTAIRMAPMFGGWRALASSVHTPPGLDRWAATHLEQLAELESGWPEASTGNTLLHGDFRSDNVLVGPTGVVTVDWPHAAVGTPILDVVEWAPSVVLEGGPPPEQLCGAQRDWAEVDLDVVGTLVAAVSGFFVYRSLLPAPPGLPTLRGFQAAQGEVALAWLRRLRGW